MSDFNFKLISLYGHIPPSLSPRSAADSANFSTDNQMELARLQTYTKFMSENTQLLQQTELANFSNEALKEFVAKHLFERNHFYNQVQTVIAVDDKNETEIVSEILSKLA